MRHSFRLWRVFRWLHVADPSDHWAGFPRGAYSTGPHLREVYNATFPNVETFPNVFSIRPLSTAELESLDSLVPTIGGRWAGKEYWTADARPTTAEGYMDGDQTGMPRALPVALCSCVSEKLRFGLIVARFGDGGLICYDRMQTFSERGQQDLDAFMLTPQDMSTRRSISSQAAHYWTQSLFATARDRFVRACTDRLLDDAIIDLSVAIGWLYLDNDQNKGRNAARRGATFASPPATLTHEYVKLRAFYLARNMILHDAVQAPVINLRDDTQFDTTATRDIRFALLRTALKVLLASPAEIVKSRQQFVADREAVAVVLEARFQAEDARF